MPASPSTRGPEADLSAAPSPWQAPPFWLAQRVIASLLSSEARWGLHVAPLRLVSAGWRAAVGEALPLLLPRPHVPVDEAAAAASRFPGLRMLRIQSPGTALMLAPDIAEEQAAALRLISAACTALRSMHLSLWSHLDEASLLPLAALPRLRTLEIESRTLRLGPAGLGALRQAPLEKLVLQCRTLACAGLHAFSALSWLDVAGRVTDDAELAPALCQLSRLRHIGFQGLPPSACAGLTRLSALPHLTSLSLLQQEGEGGELLGEGDEGPQQQQQPAEILLALLLAGGPACGTAGSSRGSGSRGGSSGSTGSSAGLQRLRRVRLDMWGQQGLAALPLAALTGLESLSVAYPALEIFPPSQVTCLAGLTELALDVRLLEDQHEEEEVGAFVSAVGRRLTALRALHLRCLQHLAEPVLEQLSGLTNLTSLSLDHAHDFGGRSLSALLSLTSLRRLSLSDPSLTPAGLGVVLLDEDAPPAFFPSLTYLSLKNCRLMTGGSLAQLVAALPTLRHLAHCGWPHLQMAHLQHVLQLCSQLQLLQTTWRPAVAPDVDRRAERVFGALSTSDPLAEQFQRQHEAERDFCRAWRVRLQHSMPVEASHPPHAPLYQFDQDQAVHEVLALPPPPQQQ